MNIDEFYKIVAGFSPNPLQEAVWNTYYSSKHNPAMLVKAGTGAGKTEAVLFPALADNTPRRIIMVLPSKALIEDMGDRIREIGKRLSQSKIADLSITVDMGGSCRRYTCKDGNVTDNYYHRHLFVDDIIVTTLDKFLFRIFGYGEKIKSYIFPHRIFGSSLEKRPFVVFDEAHEYDNLAFSNFINLLETMFVKGLGICVMSATLPDQFVDFLEIVDSFKNELGKKQANFYSKKMPSPEKKLEMIPLNSSGKEKTVNRIAEEVKNRFQKDKRIIARTESVSDIIKLYDKLRDVNPYVYHGRMTSRQRNKVISAIIEKQKKNDGFVVLATSAIEAGCDIDAHLIITEPCNPDSLVQLAGRLNRRGTMNNAQLVIVGNKIRNFVSNLDDNEMTQYMNELISMETNFQPELLEGFFQPPAGDWMGDILFEMLWEYVYDGDLTCKPLWDRGILVTRSWEPSITLCTGFNEQMRPRNPVQIGISRLRAYTGKPPDDFEGKYFDWLKNQKVSTYLSAEDDKTWHAELKRAFFSPGKGEPSRWIIRDFTGKNVSAYEASLVCVIHDKFAESYFDDDLGYIRLPKIFMRGYRDGFRQYLNYHPLQKNDGCFKGNYSAEYTGRVWYLDRTEE
jgi:CRISPR-associated endonuclease/helicase Cas3